MGREGRIHRDVPSTGTHRESRSERKVSVYGGCKAIIGQDEVTTLSRYRSVPDRRHHYCASSGRTMLTAGRVLRGDTKAGLPPPKRGQIVALCGRKITFPKDDGGRGYSCNRSNVDTVTCVARSPRILFVQPRWYLRSLHRTSIVSMISRRSTRPAVIRTLVRAFSPVARALVEWLR